MIDEDKLQKILRDFANERDWEQFHSPRNLISALTVEAGELLELFQWETEDNVVDVQNSAIKLKIEEEVADIFIYLLRVADKLGISLEDAALSKIAKNAEKYPVEASKGRSVKYTDL